MNPIKSLNKKDLLIWAGSISIILVSSILSSEFSLLTFIASCVGATSLILAAKGNVWSQILMIMFSILYGIISWQFCYWGEMITYLGMTMPMAIWSTITWMKNPSESGKEVAIQKLSKEHILGVSAGTIVVTAIFYVILDRLNTPNMFFSTLSITTSFLAASFTMLRSTYYALGYAANDVILIILWTLAAIENPAYISVVVIFVIFFFNDMYGFINWKKREKQMVENKQIEAA